jgi:phage FluMu protein Com
MDLSCKRCGKGWSYSGGRKFYATCPDCKTSVKIPEEKAVKKSTKSAEKKISKATERRMVEQEKMLGEKLEKFGSMNKFFGK